MAGEPIRVLLVEDNVANARLTEVVLSRALPEGFAVSHAASLAAALGCLAAQRFDAVLLDLGLPDSEGLDTLVRVRQSAAPDIPIVVLTGFGDEALGLRSLRCGAQDYLIKGQAGAQVLARAVLYAVERARTAAELRRLEGQVLQAVETEQGRVGRDLHGSLGQQLVGIHRMVGALARSLAARGAPEAAEADSATALLEQAIRDLRALAHILCPTVHGDGLAGALAALARRMADAHGIQCTCECRPPADLDDATGTDLYRIVQEALTNAVRHRAARHIRVSLALTDGQLRLTVEDDGQGIAEGSSQTDGIGISTMEYRARRLGGALTVRPGLRGGTIVACAVPYPAPQM